MSNSTLVIVGAAAIVTLVAVVLLVAGRASARRKRAGLQERFGPEYERAVGDADGRKERRAAEGELAQRAETRDQLDIRPLATGARERFTARWTETQAMFVDAPASALDQAETLLENVMTERGYPTDGFEEQAALVSVDHPELVENYRSAHALRDRIGRGGADTEDMRDALLRYRSLFDELLVPDDTRAA